MKFGEIVRYLKKENDPADRVLESCAFIKDTSP